VMQIKNDYDMQWVLGDGTCGEGVFNGDMGILTSINKRASTLTVQMDNRTVEYTGDKLQELETAYAMTVHKSQGNEFPAVIMPLYRFAPQLMYRNLLYTAVTRAKSLLILIGSSQVLRIMIANDKKTKRYTGLCRLITGEVDDGC
ncbi:MAG TPA: ATP-dependent RecD-like DNA helicase, partial [Ruminococcaceae bacterium]|nr:ATP-dependent RecD-like DNA helicase [Oscillospiraceae bacterium]